ncbi:hypothetical protein TrST_g874 [Triparma strigata]|uniref:Uncharacterized protein n=1 Tax=Triparma strigata TaxID=1606541 RepID=A0A9W7EGM7_9STRA|nr:hypothetical protein TrST_g874 [Triparma strigata]
MYFSKRGRTLDDEVRRHVFHTNFWNINYGQGGKKTVYDYLMTLAWIANDNELSQQVLTDPGIFALINASVVEINRRRSSVVASAQSIGLDRELEVAQSHMNSKYSVQAAFRETFPFVIASLTTIILYIWAPSGAPVQLCLALLAVFFTFAFTEFAFIREAKIDAQRFKRVAVSFFYSINALNEGEVQSKGHESMLDILMQQENEFKVTIESEEDLSSVLLAYDTIQKYISFRTRFHSGCVGGAIVVNFFTAALYLLSTTFKELTLPVMMQALLVWMSLYLAGTLAYIIYPIIKTSQLLNDEMERWLVEYQLFLCSELSRSCNASHLKSKAGTFKAQLRMIDVKIMQLQVDPRHLKLLGVEATAASLGKFLAAVLGSLLSGLMKQAAEQNQS